MGTTNTGRPLTHAVNTGWSHRACGTASHAFHLWGMATDLGSSETDAYVLSMSYDAGPGGLQLRKGDFGIAAEAAAGEWVNAVDLDVGGQKKFVLGPWRAGYELGTYGVDPRTRTAWAVVSFEGEFRVGHLDARATAFECALEQRRSLGLEWAR